MARQAGSKNELIKCEYCGEMYSVTYKHCPFCNEDGTGRWDDPGSDYDEDYEEAPRAKGGKRLAGGSRRGGGGGGYGGPSIGRIIGTIISLALIVAAVCIVISIVKSMLDKNPAGPENSPNPGVTQSVQPQDSQPPEESQSVETSPVESLPPETPPAVTPQVTPAAGSPTGFTLNREDFTFDAVGQVFQMKATYTPAGTSGDITWKSSDPNVASVSWNGVVTAVSEGTVTLTATLDGVGEQKCIVRCNFKKTGDTPASAAPSASSVPSGGGTASFTLNREDFTLKVGETFRLIPQGTSAAASWSSSNPNVASVSSDGTVTGVGKGTCSVTATIDGVSVKCIVRCSG